MDREPFTLQQAIAVCDAYKDLKGTPRLTEKGDFEVIEDILVTPYGNIHKQIFFVLYKEMNCPFKAIEFYNRLEYDIVIIFREIVPIGDGYISYINLCSYLEEIGGFINSDFLKEA